MSAPTSDREMNGHLSAAKMENVEHLLANDCSIEEACRRSGTTPSAYEKLLRDRGKR